MAMGENVWAVMAKKIFEENISIMTNQLLA